jgi:hypothetical protein
MDRDWTPPPLEVLLKQLEDFCSNAADQIRPLVAQLQECNDEYEGRPSNINHLLDRTEGRANRVLTGVMNLKATVRQLRNELLEQMAKID